MSSAASLLNLPALRIAPSWFRFDAPSARRRLLHCARAVVTLMVVIAVAKAQPAPRQLERAPATATLVPLSENWRLDGDVPIHALLISLQGLANRDQPRLYLEYPK